MRLWRLSGGVCGCGAGAATAPARRIPRFDPAMIAAQMIALQCIFYMSLGVWTVALEAAWGVALDVDLLFDSERLRGSTAPGKAIVIASLINSGVVYVKELTRRRSSGGVRSGFFSR